MKRFVPILLVVVLLALAVTPVLAAGRVPQARNSGSIFGLAGTITSLDPDAGTVTVLVHSGSRLVKPYIDKDLTLQTTADTVFLRKTDAHPLFITYSDLAIGQWISVRGKLVEGVWAVSRLTVERDS